MRPTTMAPGAKLGAQHFKTLRQLLPYLWPAGRADLKARVAAACVLLVLAKLANVYVPLFLRQAVDALDPKTAGAVLAVPLGLLLAYGAARVLALGAGELRDGLFARVAQHAIRHLALGAFRHLMALSLRFHLERRTGGLSRAIDRGAKSIEFLLYFVMFNVLPTIFEIFLVCGILWWLFDWRFAAIPLATILGYIAYTFAVTELRIRFRREMNEADNDANTKVIDSLINFETVTYFGNAEHEARRYDEALKGYEGAAVRSRASLSALNSGQALIIAAGITALMILSAYGVVAGTMTLGDFVMVNAYLIQISLPLNLLGTVYREIKQSLIDLEVMFSLLTQKAEVEDRPDAVPLAAGPGEVRFEDVSFGYDPRRPILKGVSFTASAGKTLAVVGASGAGKSTLSRLLFRFYDPTGGRVLIDGQELREVTQDSLRAAIAIVPQDTVLFNDSIGYNIEYGRPGAGRAEVERVARLARIHDFIAGLPDGYDTTVGERGLKLSGGEKQRVAIARAILKDPRILLFDEATSALDTKTEREIQASLQEVSAGRTTLVIAHRLSTVVEADEILVMEAGRIVERGRHGDLLALAGAYAGMWARQQSAKETGQGDKPEAAE
jgi:ATP-binding cassette subfamily B protein